MTHSVMKQRIKDLKETVGRFQQELLEKSNFIFTLIDIASDQSARLRHLEKLLKNNVDYSNETFKMKPPVCLGQLCVEDCFCIITEEPHGKHITVRDHNLQIIVDGFMPNPTNSSPNEQNKIGGEV